MFNNNLSNYSIIYIILAFILVSLDGTYNITYRLLKMLGLNVDQEKYGYGMSLSQSGFLLHIIVFGLLLCIPKMMCKDSSMVVGGLKNWADKARSTVGSRGF